MERILNVLKMFGLSENTDKVKKINSGHINSTYKIIYSDCSSYILQRINGNVFKKPEEIMSNIDGVCECLKGKVCCPEFLKCNNKNYVMLDGEMWRIYKYIGNSVSYITLDDVDMIYEFGRVAGNFHYHTQSLDTSKFYTIIENFHNTTYILKKLLQIRNDRYKWDFEFFERMLVFSQLLDSKKLPLKVVHNDVKPSNMLFDNSSGRGITLIDFDTVMPGLEIYDFGDGARSACITENKFDSEKFRAYCKGYFSFITPTESENYFLGMLCITSELAARYFYDFITDGEYFSDKTSKQKLSRCRELIQTAESIFEKKEEICGIIQEFE